MSDSKVREMSSGQFKDLISVIPSHVPFEVMERALGRKEVLSERLSDLIHEVGQFRPSTGLGVSLEKAAEIMGDDLLGPALIRQAFGRRLKKSEIPPLNCSEVELINAKEVGQLLILGIDKSADGQPMTAREINNLVESRFAKRGLGKILNDVTSLWGEEFFEEDVVRTGWRFVSKDQIPGSKGLNFLEQTKTLARYLTQSVSLGREKPKNYHQAIEQLQFHEPIIQKLLNINDKDVTRILSELDLNLDFRRKFVETVYDESLIRAQGRASSLAGHWEWTNSRSSDGILVGVGIFDSDGALVDGYDPDDSLDILGVSFSRSLAI